MTTLIITEKPSVAIDISKALSESFRKKDGYLEGNTLIISWALGHLLELCKPQDYDPELERWSIDALPILPGAFNLKPKSATRRQLNTIKSLIDRPDVDRLINACDAGREGELIFRYLIQYLSCRKPYSRLWLSETTPAAIKHAFSHLRSSSEVDNLAMAAVARSQADWLVGINATRAFSVQCGGGGVLTVGRVQTPTLALIVDRESKISGFVPEDYWEIAGEFSAGNDIYTGKWFRDKQDRFTSRKDAENILVNLLPGSRATISSLEQKETHELPPQLFNLTDLQKEANKRYGLTAEQTLFIAQQLYENKLLTYPRTDSRHLTRAMADTLPERLNALRRTELGKIVGTLTGIIDDKRYVDDSKVTDHTAIIITGVSPALSQLSENEQKIYLMVAGRMVTMFLPPARFLQTRVITIVGSETFISKGKVTLEQGWKILNSAAQESEDEVSNDSMPVLSQGQQVFLIAADIQGKQTTPPKRYTEADLLSAMENAGRNLEDENLREAMKGKGLGTPATRAAIIEKLIDVGYTTRQKKLLVPTEKGKNLIRIVAPQLKDPEMTGEWEQKLLEIEQGKYHSKLFMEGIKKLTGMIVNEVKSREPAARQQNKESLGNCPLCGKTVVDGKKGYGCSGWREGCKFVIWKTIAGKRITEANVKQLLKSGKSNLIKGFKSRKETEFDAYLKLEDGKVVFAFPPRKAAK